ncbi:LysE family translocator [Streptomyces sp. NPDC048504]|uniref:LysE family translocator n=1 Tax=Streptomyces sp. NPDC048504 TaxID=3365559 RepID=UPI003717598E
MISDVEWTTFFPAALLIAASPGANQLLALRNGLRYGWGSAISASLGRFTAFALMVGGVAAGLGAVLAASELAFNVIKWCGVVYLAWLGLRTALTAVRHGGGRPDRGTAGLSTEDGDRRRHDGPSAWRRARQEFVVAASNPKALILFTVFLPQFLTRGADGAATPLLALGAAYIGVEFCCAFGYAALGSRLKNMGISRRARRLLDVVTGVAMLGLAGWPAGRQPSSTEASSVSGCRAGGWGWLPGDSRWRDAGPLGAGNASC